MLQEPKTSRKACRQICATLDAWRPIRIELLNYRKEGSEFWDPPLGRAPPLRTSRIKQAEPVNAPST